MKTKRPPNPNGERVAAHRDNKTAKGMTRTFYRSQRSHSSIANTLSVRGTLDELRSRWIIRRAKCPCCGQSGGGKCILSEHGALKLRNLRRRRADGLVQRAHPFFLK